MSQVQGFVYTLPVTTLTWVDGAIPSPSTGTLRLETTEPNATFTYSVDFIAPGQLFPGELPFVSTFGPPVRIRLDDEVFFEDLIFVSRLTGTSGNTGHTDVLGLFRGSGVEPIDVIVTLGGDPLPALSSSQDVLDFIGGLTEIGPIPAGTPFAAGEPVALSDFPGMVVTQGLIDPIDDVDFDFGGGGTRLPHDRLAEVISAEGHDDADAAMEALLFRLIGAAPAGIAIGDVTYIGALRAAAWFDDFTIEALEPGKTDLAFGSGIMLSTGAMPNDRNTSPGFTIDHGTPGDDQLTETAIAAFPLAGETYDAAIIEFTIDVTDPAIDGLRLGLVFGSEEFPEFADSSFVDIAAVYVNGVNVALFNNDPATPLSVTQRNIDAGNFIDNNQPWPDVEDWDVEFPLIGPAHYAVEWDGFSRQLSVRAPLEAGSNTVRIGIADTGDADLDSALFINQLQLTSGGGTISGVLNSLDATAGGTVQASSLQEEIIIGDAPVVLQGAPQDFDNDVVVNFKPGDKIAMQDSQFGMDQVQIDSGSAILRIDTDSDGVVDTTMRFAGDFSNRLFDAEVQDGATVLTASETELARVSGVVRDVSGAVLDGVTVRAEMAGAVPRSSTTEGGAFSFDLPDVADAPLSINGVLDYATGSAPSIGVNSALSVLRLAVGVDAPTSAATVIAADFNGDGRVGIDDALEILRHALGLESSAAPRWVFVDSKADLSGISPKSVSFDEGISLGGLTGPLQDLDLTAILVGNL